MAGDTLQRLPVREGAEGGGLDPTALARRAEVAAGAEFVAALDAELYSGADASALPTPVRYPGSVAAGQFLSREVDLDTAA